MKKLGLLILVMLAFSVIGASAQATKRVTFAKGKKAVVFNDSANTTQKDTYIVKLKKGESVDVNAEWVGEDVNDEGQGLSGLTIIEPGKAASPDVQDGAVTAERAGDYKFVVSAPYKKTNYRYKITFTKQ